MISTIATSVSLALSTGASGGDTEKMSYQNPDMIAGTEDSIVREIASAVIIPGNAHRSVQGDA